MKQMDWKGWVVCFLGFLAVGELLLAVLVWRDVRAEMSRGQLVAQATMNQLNLVMQQEMEKTETWEAFLQLNDCQMMDEMLLAADGKACLDDFNCLAVQLYEPVGVRAVQLLPGGVVLYTYPYETNSGAIGDDILHREGRKEDAVKAMELGERVVSGPLDLKQGGLGLIGRNPIYYPDGTFWGFSAVVLDIPDVLEPFGLNSVSNQGYEYRLTAGEGDQIREISSTLSGAGLHPVKAQAELFHQNWTLEVCPKGGWYSLGKLTLGGLFAAVLAGVLATAVTRARMYARQTERVLVQERKAREAAVQACQVADLANAARNTFLTTMSRDIRTPMNAIVGLCTLLERDAGDPERVLEHTRKITVSSQHLLGLINDMLETNQLTVTAQETGSFDEGPSVQKEEDGPHESALSGLNVLAAEDNEINGEILVELLAIKGASCTLCTDGQQVVAQLESAQPGTYQLILMDVQMPVMDGLEATQNIRKSQHPDGASIPILAMTASALAEDRRATREAGMDGHIAKPVDLDVLEQEVARILCQKQR